MGSLFFAGIFVSQGIWAQSGPAFPTKAGSEDGSMNSAKPSKNGDSPRIETPDPPSRSADHENSVGFGLVKHIALDQAQIWTSPRHLRWADADLLVPFGMVTGTLLATDTDVSKHLSNSPNRLHRSQQLSNYGVGTLVAAGGGMYVWGKFTHDEHKRETGILSGEAAINAFLVTSAFKYSFGRTRPLDQPKYAGEFWHGGTSLPSEHAAAAWAIASVMAHEYHGQLTSFLLYGLASAVSMSRVTAKQHFPTDVFIGSAIGWYMGKQAFRAHHDPELGGTEWQSYGEFIDSGPNGRTTSLGTTFVPLDSWIYPALERLASLGYIKSDYMGVRPWSRFECAKLVQQASEKIVAAPNPTPEIEGESGRNGSAPAPTAEIAGLYAALVKEFARDTERAGGGTPEETSGRLESIYTRVTNISGPPLHDSYHFGETITNDFGRPFGRGMNVVAGSSGWAAIGRFALYVNEEYQYGASSPTYSGAVNSAIAQMDNNPVQPGVFPSTSQLQLREAYISSTQSNWIFSFGKQNLWWGPNTGSDLILSNNAQPLYMFRVSRAEAIRLPWIFAHLGPMKLDAFYGKLSGNQFPQGPQLHGEKISFKLLPDFEVGFSRTVELGGVGEPLTLRRLWRSYTSTTTISGETPANDPGKRIGGFDFNWRLPYIGNWLTLYLNSIATDNTSPLADFNRSGVNPGIYLSHFPKLSKWDLRLEAVYTDTPVSSVGGHFIYYDAFYHDLYTNRGQLIGSWIGRQGHGYQAWTSYHVSARNWIQFAYRHANVSPSFVPQGGSLNDGSVSVNWWVHRDLNLSGLLQYERWNYPLLAPGPQTNWTSSLQVQFCPSSWKW